LIVALWLIVVFVPLLFFFQTGIVFAIYHPAAAMVIFCLSSSMAPSKEALFVAD